MGQLLKIEELLYDLPEALRVFRILKTNSWKEPAHSISRGKKG
jgi:hypothetical protein